ncbi:NUDIX hydrolase [Aspergillus candidus]|uniref:Nudix hydrolase domain-containing protein n=1 Tax=Aspergillus candidus TaxID=41067 RepID=A0A2I2FEX7_ASPCN|nr:hypothetical protein BDW47DRAFT_17083 [Aspergillus candidus]PLB39184.1 hypothetical protein BDW47DRAFT_17083 [Aspergillus candidus]
MEPVSNSLHEVLVDLHRHPYPHVPNPPSCKKRASVALILRVRPTYNHWPGASSNPSPDSSSSTKQQLDTFFSQSWVQNGDPEAVFIKRASRVGDRWTGHVALPGGRRDPEDADDRAAAIRETSEEIGLDLTPNNCIYIGNLPERVVTTSWGAVPLMVLCPFVFLLTSPESPSLKLQPTEVASTHWVPLRALLSPALRTVEYVDMSQRLPTVGGFATRLACRAIMGLMQFSAIRLVSTESLYCNTTPGLIPTDTKLTPTPWFQRWKTPCGGQQGGSGERAPPLLLWGLTLGILADFLDMLPPHSAVTLWKYPTFTTPDLRLIVSLMTYRLRKQNTLRVRSGRRASDTAVDGQTAALPVTRAVDAESERNHVGIGGLGVGRYYGSSDRSPDGNAYAVGIMLKGYYDRLRVAIYIYLAWRAALGSVAGYTAWKLLRR